MATRYFCDICNSQVPHQEMLSKLTLTITGLSAVYRELCPACKRALHAKIQAIFGEIAEAKSEPEAEGD